jgi:hypothetical protein
MSRFGAGAAFALCLVIFGCTPTETATSLDAHAAAMDSAALSYRHEVRPLSGFSARNGTLDSYYDGAALRKLVATHFRETGRAVDTFYFQGGNPFLVVRTEEQAGRPASGRVTWRTVDRVYFSGGRLLLYLDAEGRARDLTDSRVRDRVDGALADSRRLAVLLGTPTAAPSAPPAPR